MATCLMSVESDGDNSSCTGCTDSTACNYDMTATINDGVYIEEGKCDCEGNELDVRRVRGNRRFGLHGHCALSMLKPLAQT